MIDMSAWPPYDSLISGNIWGSFVGPYIEMMGYDMFLLIIVALLTGMTYIKTRDVSLVSLMFVLCGSVIIPFLSPQVQIYFALIVVLGVTAAAYNFYRSNR
jgi:hypothetical protein